MIDENDVVSAVAAHLEKAGYRISQQLSTVQHGIDLIAENEQTGEILLVEAKGGTSTVLRSNRYGRPYTQSQVLDRVSKGFYTAAVLHGARRVPDREHVALAIPETDHFLRYARDVKPTAEKLGISILVVKDDRTVYEL